MSGHRPEPTTEDIQRILASPRPDAYVVPEGLPDPVRWSNACSICAGIGLDECDDIRTGQLPSSMYRDRSFGDGGDDDVRSVEFTEVEDA